MTGDLPAALAVRTAFMLQQATMRAKSMGEDALRELGIGGREYGVLAVLGEMPALPQSRIAEILGIDRTSILTLVAGLEGRGLVQRDRDATDRRAYAVTLTADGERARATAFDVLTQCEQRFLRPLNAEQQDTLHELLTQLNH